MKNYVITEKQLNDLVMILNSIELRSGVQNATMLVQSMQLLNTLKEVNIEEKESDS